MEKIEAKILELEYTILSPMISMGILVSNIRRGDKCWVADITLDQEITIYNCEYPDKYFDTLEVSECATNP
jgi:hypothetical protein